MITANEYGQIRLEGRHEKSLMITATDRKNLPPIHLIAFVSGGNVSLYLTLEEASAVIAQLEKVTAAVWDGVVA